MPGPTRRIQTTPGASVEGRGTSLPWRALLAAAVLSLALGTAVFVGSRGERSAVAPLARAHAFSRESLLSLPLAAQGPVSAALGSDSAAYRVSPSRGGFSARTPEQHLSSRFSASGVSVAFGRARLGLSLRGAGYGSSLKTLAAVAPRVHQNRVLYAYPGLSAWYANGPLGLEQGFTVARAPAGHPAGPLTLSIALSANGHLSLAAAGHGLVLSRAGKAALRYTGLAATDARGHLLPSSLALEGGRLLLRVDVRGASYPLRIDPFVQEAAKITGGEESGKGGFGESVALSADGNTALIGAPEDEGGIGAAWVFTRSGSTWTQQGEKLTPDDPDEEEFEFGSSVALSADGNTALIGGRYADEGAGAAWVFTRSGSAWSQQGRKLTAHGESGSGEFGASVALSGEGDTAVIGAPEDNSEVGAAWAFTRSGSTWSQQGEKLTGAGEVEGGEFGASVALSGEGDTALIGGPYDEGGSGAAWVFARSGSTWTQQGEKLTGNRGGETNSFGTSVALSHDGETALVGGPDEPGGGAAWVFTRSGETWAQQGEKLTGGEESGAAHFGASVALSEDGASALIGGPYDGDKAGAAWVFTRAGETWTQEGEKLTGQEAVGEGLAGASVALSADGETALVGGRYDNTRVGAAWVFEDLAVPTVVTGSASEVLQTSATLNATVDPAGETVSECKFEYGTTVAYGSSVPCTPMPGAEDGPVAVSASLSGLNPHATYHFRISASNQFGFDRGRDATFTASGYAEAYLCTKKSRTGDYTESACLKLGTKGNYERSPIAGAKYKSTSKTDLLSTAGGEVTCKKARAEGEWTGPKTGVETITFSGCRAAGAKCTSAGQASGTIKTSTLDTLLIAHGEAQSGLDEGEGYVIDPPEGEVWQELASAAGAEGALVEYSCEGREWRTDGVLAGVLSPVNVLAHKTAVAFAAGKGLQELDTTYSSDGGAEWIGTGRSTWTLLSTVKDAKGTVIAALNGTD